MRAAECGQRLPPSLASGAQCPVLIALAPRRSTFPSQAEWKASEERMGNVFVPRTRSLRIADSYNYPGAQLFWKT